MRHLGGNARFRRRRVVQRAAAAFARLTPALPTSRMTTPLAEMPHTSRAYTNDLHGRRVTSHGPALSWVVAMSGSEWRPTRLTPEQVEERRLAAARLLHRGRMTQAAIARHLGVSRAASAAGRQSCDDRAGTG